MIERLKTLTLKILNFFHLLIFKTEMGEITKNFVKNISYTTLGSIGSTFFLFFVNIAAVRVLGPEEYGKYILISSAIGFLEIPMFLGLSASLMKYLPEAMDKESKLTVIATSFWMILAFTFVSVLIFLFFKSFFSSLFGLSITIFVFAILYGAVNVFQLEINSILRGLHEFKKLAVLQILFAASIFVSFFLLLFFSGDKTFRLYVWSIVIGSIVYSLYYLITNRRQFSLFNVDINKFRTLLSYGFLTVLNLISWFFISNSDRFFINKFENTAAVGVYAVYVGASMIIINKGLSPFLGVFFPTVSGMSNKLEINSKLNKLLKIGVGPFLVVNFFLMYIMFKIYGSKYPVNFVWFLFFSINAILYTIGQIKWNLIFSQGTKALKTYALYSFVGAAAILVLNFLFIPKFGIAGALGSSIFVSLFLLVTASVYLGKLKNQAV